MRSQFSLIATRRFGPYFFIQALGALNDSLFGNALLVLITFSIVELGAGGMQRDLALAGGLFVLPFLLFSALAGQLAEGYDKARLIRRLKLFEVAIAGLGAMALLRESLPWLFVALFLLGTRAALFSAVKYSILPQQLRDDELMGGNGLVASSSFVAILAGGMLGGWLIGQRLGAVGVGVATALLALLGFVLALALPPAPTSAPKVRLDWNLLREMRRSLAHLQGNRTLLLAVLGVSWFWFVGIVFFWQLPGYTLHHLQGDPQTVALLLTVACLGLGIGALLCEHLSDHRVELGLVPLGSIGLTVFGIDLFFATPNAHPTALVDAASFLADVRNHRLLWDLGLMGVSGGFYVVPLYALIQSRSDPQHRSRVIAANNVANAVFMVAATLMAYGLLKAGLSIAQLWLAIALMNAVVAVFIYAQVPEFLMRFLTWLMINSLYRIRASGLEHIPAEGPAIVVCNHVSYVDALIVGGSSRRPVRFVMYYKIFQVPVLNFIFRTARCIPIAPAKEDAALLREAYEEIDSALANGELIGIFPEGRLTPDGDIHDFKNGIERILQRRPVPVVPVALRGLWRSMWSRRDSALGRLRLPRRIRARVQLIVDAPLPGDQVNATLLEQRVKNLRGDVA